MNRVSCHCTARLHEPRAPGIRDQRRQSGSAMVIVLILLAVMAALVLSNAVVLRQLQTELQLLEQKQNQRLQLRALQNPSVKTNSP